MSKLKSHVWEPVESSKGVWGYHRYACKNCGKETHIGLDIDYEVKECASKRPKAPQTQSIKGDEG